MSDHEISDNEIREALTKFRRIAVIGLSPEPNRPSHGVSQYMQGMGYEISGVRPGGAGPILGRPSYSSLTEVPGPLEIIDVFRKSDAVAGIVDDVLREIDSRPAGQGPKVLWLQEGVTDPQAEERARARGLMVVSNRCILKEHRRLMQG